MRGGSFRDPHAYRLSILRYPPSRDEVHRETETAHQYPPTAQNIRIWTVAGLPELNLTAAHWAVICAAGTVRPGHALWLAGANDHHHGHERASSVTWDSGTEAVSAVGLGCGRGVGPGMAPQRLPEGPAWRACRDVAAADLA